MLLLQPRYERKLDARYSAPWAGSNHPLGFKVQMFVISFDPTWGPGGGKGVNLNRGTFLSLFQPQS